MPASDGPVTDRLPNLETARSRSWIRGFPSLVDRIDPATRDSTDDLEPPDSSS